MRRLRRERTKVLIILESCMNNRTGTDGFRLLCHQFYTSSLPRLAHCISRSKTCSLTMKHRTPALLRWLANGDQGQNTRTTVFPLNTGRQWYIVWWSRRNRSAQLQPHMESRMKRSVASYFMSRSSVGSRKLNGTYTCSSPSKRHTLFLVPKEGSDCPLARSATVLLLRVSAE
jgi:hypothetical protein